MEYAQVLSAFARLGALAILLIATPALAHPGSRLAPLLSSLAGHPSAAAASRLVDECKLDHAIARDGEIVGYDLQTKALAEEITVAVQSAVEWTPRVTDWGRGNRSSNLQESLSRFVGRGLVHYQVTFNRHRFDVRLSTPF